MSELPDKPPSDLSNLSDEANHLLMELAYCSHLLIKGEELGNQKEAINEAGRLSTAAGETLYERLERTGLLDLTITNTGNDDETGFGAIAFSDSFDNTGISYRGTDGITWDSLRTDWPDNISAMLVGTSAQSGQASQFFTANHDENGNNYLYGHSKGGELAASRFVENPNLIKQIHLLNPQPLNKYKLTPEQIALLNDRTRCDIVCVEEDYVWLLGRCPYLDNIRWTKRDGNPHNQSSALYDNEDIIPSERSGINSFVGGFIGRFLGIKLQRPLRFIASQNWIAAIFLTLLDRLMTFAIKRFLQALLRGVFNGLMELVESALSKFLIPLVVNWITAVLALAARILLNMAVRAAIDVLFSIVGLAEGGFPAPGKPFIAREAGPELVGRLNGQTAVVNNDQIVEAVSRGVYGAVRSAMYDKTSSFPGIAKVFLDGKQIAMAGQAG